jgi:predicted MFS family arabinose efflux permease
VSDPHPTEPAATVPAEGESGRWSDVFSGRLGIYTLVLILGTTLFAVTNFVVVAIMPAVAADIGGLGYYAWAFSLFAVGAVIGASGIGPVREAFGDRASYVGGGLVFVIGLAGAALAPKMEFLVGWRLIQGIGGGAIASQAYALIAQMYPEHLRGRALGLLSTSWGVAVVLGPAFGGTFAEFGIWRDAFWTLAALGVVFAVLAHRVVPSSERIGRLENFPITRLGLLAAAVLGLSATSQIDDNGWRAALVALSVAVAVIAFRRDARADRGLFPREAMIIYREMGAAFWIVMMSTMALVAITMFVTLYLQVLHGISPIVAALIFILNSLSWTVTAVLISSWSVRRQDICIVTGLALLFLGFFGISQIVAAGPVVAIAGLLVMTGTGIGLMNNPLIQRAIAAAPAHEKGRTGSSVHTIRTLGQSFGAAVAGLVAAASGLGDNATPAILGRAMEWVYLTGAAYPAIGLLIAIPLFMIGRRHHAASEAQTKT